MAVQCALCIPLLAGGGGATATAGAGATFGTITTAQAITAAGVVITVGAGLTMVNDYLDRPATSTEVDDIIAHPTSTVGRLIRAHFCDLVV